MNTTRKVMLAGSTAVALAMVASAASAQTVPDYEGDWNGGGLYTEDPFISDGSPVDVTNTPVVGGLYDSIAVQSGTVDFEDGVAGIMNLDDFYGVDVFGTVVGSYTTEETIVTHIDLNVPSAVADPANYVNTLDTITQFDVFGSASTGTPITATTIASVPGTIVGNTVQVTQTNSTIDANGVSFATYQTTATYNVDPNNGNNNEITAVWSGPPVTETTLDANGLTTTGNVTAGNVYTNNIIGDPQVHIGTANGASYIDVNEDNVVIHGGTTSTTVTVDNGGVQITDSTNGNTLLINNSGQISNNGSANGGYVWVEDSMWVTGDIEIDGTTWANGNLDVDGDAQFDSNVNVSGFTTTNGLDNTGGLETDALQVNGASNFAGLITSNGIDNTGGLETDTLQVNGAANFDAQITTNGIDNTGAITTDTLDVDGAANVDGTLTVGGAVIANGGINTATIWNGTQNAGAGVTVQDSLTVNGQINAGNVTSANNTIGGTNATSSTLAAGTSYVQVNADNVQIHGGTNSTNLSVSDAGLRITNNNTGASATANGTGANLFIAADGSISSSNTGLNGGAVTVSDQLVVRAGSATAGFGGIQTGTVAINTTGNNKISGLANATLSATSTEAVTGQQLFATNQALAALDAREAAHYSQLMDRADKAYQGVAMNFALNAAPLALDNGEGGISGGVGYFQGEWAGAVKAQYVTDSGIGVGINVGFSEDAVGGGVGASIKF